VKIQNHYKVNQNESVSKNSKKKSQSSESSSAVETTHVELSESASFVQGLREAAEGVDPQEVRMDVVEASREDVRKGLLGSDEDYEQAISALLIENDNFED
jgi:hypothetical protein